MDNHRVSNALPNYGSKCTFLLGQDPGPHLNTYGSLGPHKSPETVSESVRPFQWGSRSWPTDRQTVVATGHITPHNHVNQKPDRWSGVRPAPVCVLIVLEVLMAFFRAFNCRILHGLYLPAVILTIIWYSITHSLFLSRLKTFLLYKSFPL